MAAPVIMGAASLAIGAVGTVSSINSQRRQAEQQAQVAEARALELDQQLGLAVRHYELVNEKSKLMEKQEVTLNRAQRRQAMLEITNQVLQQKMQDIQTQMQATGIRSQAMQQASEILQGTQEAVGQAYEQSQAELGQAAEMKGITGTSTSSVTGLEMTNRANEQLAQQQNRLAFNAERTLNAGQLNLGLAGELAGLVQGFGELGASSIEQQLALAQGFRPTEEAFARGQVRSTTKRNRIGIRAEYATQRAQQNALIAAQSDTIAAQQSAYRAQAEQARASKPGYGQVLGGVLQGGLGLADQLGLFNPPVPTPRPMTPGGNRGFNTSSSLNFSNTFTPTRATYENLMSTTTPMKPSFTKLDL